MRTSFAALRKNKHWSVNNKTEEDMLIEVSVPSSNDTSFEELSDNNRTRERRSTSDKASAVIETAVFIDQALYDQMRRTFPSDTDRQLSTFVLTMMNAVNFHEFIVIKILLFQNN